jgi:predicted nucleic acid-binding protein
MMSIETPPPGTSLALDNNTFTHWRNRHQYVEDAITTYQKEFKVLPALTSITVFEALHGIEDDIVKKGGLVDPWKRAKDRIDELVINCTVLPLNEAAAAIAAHIFPRLMPRLGRKDRRKAWADIFIAATVLAHNYGLVTTDKDFKLIGDLLPDARRLYVTAWRPNLTVVPSNVPSESSRSPKN